ncbi:hypothetical protein GCM10007231_00360 [Nocardioides daphniae]|uniref:Uncharacterized protein n=1 Tax=Nocardioides daphniae TaxID=402297 RepID=A0ABQ1PWM0_9ACTN|nr:hypothetical protein GCM10007231_00360 [Nocardioides daphniae]
MKTFTEEPEASALAAPLPSSSPQADAVNATRVATAKATPPRRTLRALLCCCLIGPPPTGCYEQVSHKVRPDPGARGPLEKLV